MIYFSTDKLRKKKFGTNKKFAFFFDVYWGKFERENCENMLNLTEVNTAIIYLNFLYLQMIALMNIQDKFLT